MSDDDLKTNIAVMQSRLENMASRLEKMERNVQWATLLIVGSVIAAVLKQVGLS